MKVISDIDHYHKVKNLHSTKKPSNVRIKEHKENMKNGLTDKSKKFIGLKILQCVGKRHNSFGNHFLLTI